MTRFSARTSVYSADSCTVSAQTDTRYMHWC